MIVGAPSAEAGGIDVQRNAHAFTRWSDECLAPLRNETLQIGAIDALHDKLTALESRAPREHGGHRRIDSHGVSALADERAGRGMGVMKKCVDVRAPMGFGQQ